MIKVKGGAPIVTTKDAVTRCQKRCRLRQVPDTDRELCFLRPLIDGVVDGIKRKKKTPRKASNTYNLITMPCR